MEKAEVGADDAVTISGVIERVGLTGHHVHTILLNCWVWIFCGWTGTLVVFLLDAAGLEHGDWLTLASASERLTIDDRSLALLVTGIVATVCNPSLGNLSDVWGRVPLLELSVLVNVACIIGYVLARSKVVLIALVVATQMDVAHLVSQALLAEWLPVAWRGIFVVALHAFWNVGRLGVTLLWATLPPSQHWTAFFTLASILPAIMAVFLRARGWRYESPRWLAVSGDMERCVATLRLAVESRPCDGDALPLGWDTPGALRLDSASGESVQAGRRLLQAQLAQLREPKLLKFVAVLGILSFGLGFAASGLFYWVMEFLKAVGAKAAVVPVMSVAPMGKIAGAVALLAGGRRHCVVDRYPRVLLLKIGFLGASACVGLFCVTTNKFALAAVMFMAQVFEEVIWSVSGIYATELFPTTVRNTAIGLITMSGSVGAVTSAVVSGRLMEIWVYLPIVAITSFLSMGGAACWLLTEERGSKPLLDTASYGSCGDKMP